MNLQDNILFLICTEISITAPPDRIWHLLTDFASYPQWKPFIRRASGELREGATVKEKD